ncbi:uncharacterized protein LOC105183237 isoform X2 [Harpegnathos saltator]|uniref:uncharacterized protein LOC105183237 isoform X2 n=1 Tax=Harpegnathos saltator TaxID=610380 RepID=UPI00058AE0F1|nr:uncharacterized protein LOC105183237 isoform X2 [Harpegnathos saltator]
MEKFKQIDWNISLENLIDDVFITDERLEKDSAIYKIMNDNFTDPFNNIADDYKEINIEELKSLTKNINDLEENKDEDEDEDNIKYEIKEECKEKQNTKKHQKSMKKEKIMSNKKCYVPGMRKLPSQFVRNSSLNATQHAMCSRVLLRLSNYEVTPTLAEEKTELECYMALQKTISTEQNKFLTLAKKIWDDSAPWPIKYNVYIELRWGKKMFELKKLPRYYVETSNVPFSLNKDIIVKFISCLQKQGTFSEVVLPKLDKPYFLEIDSKILFRKYPPSLSSTLPHFKLPVSEDTYCTNLAESTKVDLVISSSGLKCLLNNIALDFPNSWAIPVVIKSHHEKNIVYIDKKLPPTGATSLQKNTWVYKYILRHCLVPTEVASVSTEVISSDGKTFAEEDKIVEENESMTEVHETLSGPMESQNQCKLIKDSPKEYQILVRTKTDCVQALPNGQLQLLMLAPKLEHQLALGAEAATLEESLEQWTSLMFRPDTSLARVRIAAESGEIIQIERHTVMSLSAEIQRLYKIKVKDSLAILHNVIEKLSCLTPGRYLMRYTAQHGPFAYVYKETDECGKNNFDLHSVYESEVFNTISDTPWPPIDTILMTPTHKYLYRMPAMFNQNKMQTFNSTNVTSGVSGIKKHTEKNRSISNQKVPVRRSLREKKPSRKLIDM